MRWRRLEDTIILQERYKCRQVRHFLPRENSQRPRAFPRAHSHRENNALLRERDNGACKIFTRYTRCNGREFISKHDNNGITSTAV